MKPFRFLRNVYAVSCDEFGHRKDDNLSDLYVHLPETDKVNSAFCALLDKLQLPMEQRDRLTVADSFTSDAHALEGFINGWRFCEMVRDETRDREEWEALQAQLVELHDQLDAIFVNKEDKALGAALNKLEDIIDSFDAVYQTEEQEVAKQ